MLKLCVVLSLVFAVIALPQHGVVPGFGGRIIGGNDTDITNYPYTVALEFTGSRHCGGTIIGSKWIVTAAHCVAISNDASLFTVHAGSTDISIGGQKLSAARIIRHPNYSRITLDNDIALLELSEDIIFNNATAVIDMPPQGSDAEAGTTSVVTGWGALGENEPSAINLQVVEVPIVERSQCYAMYQTIARNVTERMLCAGVVDGGGKDACRGDSGGPLTVNGLLFGIVSWGLGCGRSDYPGVYANVGAFRDWVFENSGI